MDRQTLEQQIADIDALLKDNYRGRAYKQDLLSQRGVLQAQLDAIVNSRRAADSGVIDYNDTSPDVALAANTWTDIPNNGLGQFSNDKYSVDFVNNLLDPATGYLDFDELQLGDSVYIRIDFAVAPNINNALLECRYVLGEGANEYPLDVFSKRCDKGAGVMHSSDKFLFSVYMGDINTYEGPAKLQAKLSSAGTLSNAGVAIEIRQ